jgi:uncharacterized iron-regulated membrane protein
VGAWQRWTRAPQTLGWRRFLFQLHLWLGVGLGLYVLVIALSGTALLLKSPFYTWFEPKWLEPTADEPLKGDALKARMAEVYAGYELGFMMEAWEENKATYIVLNRNGEYFPHYFNQYTGEDLGPSNPWPIKAVEKLADLHDDLLLGRLGKQINGVGGALFVLMSLSGLLLWWQGRSRWYEALLPWPGRQHSLLWQLHACLGFWGLLLMLAWGVSGFQLGFPREMATLLRWVDAEPGDGRGAERVLRFFRAVHFTRFGEGELVRWAWIAASLLPTLLFVSGLVVWWRRVVLRRRLKAAQA